MPDPPKIYWDASVFLSYVNGDPARLPDIDAYLARSGREIQIVTSALSVAEVAFGKVEQDNRALDPRIERKIDALWFASDSPVRLIEFFPLLAFETKAFIREALAQGLAVPKPADAMHMVTAKEIGAVEIHTYDIEGNRAWPRYQPLVGVRIGEPNAPNLQYTLEFIARPPMREQVPDGPEEHPAPPN